MEGKLIKLEDGYLLIDVNTSNEDRWSVIGSYPFNKDVEKLSLKNCQAIANGYDLDELSKSEAIKISETEVRDEKLERIYKRGFQKALEILGDKKFSEEDMLNAYNEGGNDGANLQSMAYNEDDDISGYKEELENNFIQSLQQTEWNVIVEMECPECKEYGYISECRNECNKKFTQPKLDADGCLILKRK